MSRNSSIPFEFWSSVELSGFMRSIVAHMKADGFENVRHRYLIREASYRKSVNAVQRLWLRIQMYLINTAFFTARMLFHRGPAVIVVTSNPFFAPLIACLLRSKQQTVVHLVYDLYPDALVQARKIREGSFLYRIINRILAITFRKADANVILAEGLRGHIQKRFKEIRNPIVIPVGADDMEFDNPEGCKSREGEALRLLYCGNIGYMHDLDTLAETLRSLDTEGNTGEVRISIRASGPGFPRLRNSLSNLSNPGSIELDGYLPYESWRSVMSESDIAIVSIRHGAEKVLMPSKTYSAMQAGQAIIAIAPPDSDLAETVRRHDCGWVVESGDVETLKNLITSLPSMREEITRRQKNAHRAAQTYYSARIVATQWEKLARKISGEQAEACGKIGLSTTA